MTTKKYFIVLLISLIGSVGLVGCTQLSSSSDSIALIDDSQSNICIVLPENSEGVLQFAATELQEYLYKISGVKVQVVNKCLEGLIPIKLGVVTDDAINVDAFTVSVNKEKLTLLGQNQRSVLYAVYALLEKIGCMWIYPGEAEEHIPALTTVSLQIGEKYEKTSVEHRGLGLYELHGETVDLGADMIDWMGKNKLNLLMTSEDRIDEIGTQCMHWPEVKDVLYPELMKRGMLLELSEHMTHVYFPPSLGKEHPEWFALVNGKRSGTGQVCFSNEEASEFFGDRVAEYVGQHPEADIVGTWPLDGGGYCECEGCKDPLTIYKAISKVAKKAAKVNPKTTIEFLAYVDQTFSAPEGLEIPENLSVLMCDRLDDNAKRWSELLDENGSQGQYYFEYVLGDNYRWRTNVWMIPGYGPWLERKVVDTGFRGVVSLFLPIRNWWRSAFNNYFMAKAYWNSDLDVDLELRNYCEAYYGELSDDIFEVLNAIRFDVQNNYMMEAYHWEIIHPMEGAKIAKHEDGYLMSQQSCDKVIDQLQLLLSKTSDDKVSERICRLQSYLEYFKIYYQERTVDGKAYPKTDNSVVPNSLLEYSEQHPIDKDGVNMNPEFIKWRFERFHW
ncbi:DUF4838 domain-containing protein [Carboxylicivirga sp. N1Y90]|uniref:DUF4838 domain-containing protein n=1 Tax=Carboxylicivirga fragile TaxID=3417571 RepID=UPI003D3412E3|nr:DUF4838 domain-containing protein [Marinilabiliaceae bacterium N1Y90]